MVTIIVNVVYVTGGTQSLPFAAFNCISFLQPLPSVSYYKHQANSLEETLQVHAT